ncbi:hypothetical protein [Azomonas macrocytogenes]|uniref:Uncharacterized protein n=1 Tax=Azomonas macrocytogenes TaxID=69962 RepID=A0A839T325_AZOMA|nr:hypothetical protein [Azomonas macrocytogenes]MBB3103060.1 hypothetical protein [Azomonas macrocytogenes]
MNGYAQVMRDILSCWSLGDGDDSTVTTYKQALLFNAVDDVLVPEPTRLLGGLSLDTERQKADCILVGSGVTGALVAHQLALAGKDVLILEPALTKTFGARPEVLFNRFSEHLSAKAKAVGRFGLVLSPLSVRLYQTLRSGAPDRRGCRAPRREP